MNRLLLSAGLSAMLTTAYAAPESSEQEMLDLLQQDLQHFTELATDTNQNVDYMPYVISTLQNRDLIDLGIQNLREALTLVPGVDLTVGMAGVKNPIFRGSNPYAFGQSRLIIDGVVVNDQIFGGYNQYLEMPVDIIHRIEVVRGPGSLQHHVNGFAGTIHVITKANRDDGKDTKDEVFVVAGVDNHKAAGLVNSIEFEKGSFTSDIYYQENDSSLAVGVDRYGNQGDSDQSLENYQLGLNYHQGGFTAMARLSSNQSGVSYGQAFSLSDDPEDFLDVANNIFELKYEINLTDSLQLEVAAGYRDEVRELQNKVVPDGAMVMMMGVPVVLVDGRYFLVDYKEQTLTQRVQLKYKFSSKHRLILGGEFLQTEIRKNDAAISDDDLVSTTDFNLFSIDERDVNTYYIEDYYDYNDATSFQLGFKYSDYSDEEGQSAYRLAMVHRLNDSNIFKLMYSQAYREPSFREQYLNAQAFFQPNTILEVENVDAYELAYIHKLSHRDFIKFNVFLLNNENQIDAQNTNRTFVNTESNKIHGYELEYETSISSNDLLGFNVSVIDGENVTGSLSNSSEILYRLYYRNKISENWNVSSVFKYTGEKDRILIDARESVETYSLLDLSASYFGFGKTTRLSLSLKNIFDEEYYFPSPNMTYQDDFEQYGRTWMIRLSKEF